MAVTIPALFPNRVTRVGLVTAGKWLGKDEHRLATRHSDREKFRSNLNRPESSKIVNRRGVPTPIGTLSY